MTDTNEPDAKDAPSRTEFAQLIMQKLASVGDTRTSTFHEEEFQLAFKQGEKDCGVLNLTNLYAEFTRVDAEHRDAKLSSIVRAALSHLKPMPEALEEAKYDLRPRLWSRSTLEQLKLRSRLTGDQEPEWPTQLVGSHLILTIVFDLPESVRSVSIDDLEAWGLSFWEAREICVENLSEDEYTFATVGDLLYASVTGDSYDATRIVLSSLIEQMEVEGEFVAMVPNRDTLLITGSDSAVGLKMMVEFAAKEFKENPRPLSPVPLVYRDGQWEDWEFPQDHESYPDFHRIQLGFAQMDYESQKAILDEVYEHELVEEFVASFTVVTKEDGELMSYSVWGRDVIVSLPKTDMVAIMDKVDDDPLLVPWDELLRVCGDLISEQEYYPPRFLVREFPSDSQLERLKQFTV